MANLHLVTGYKGEAHITAADHGSFNAAIFGVGQYVLERGSEFSASVITNNSIRVSDGDILMQGRHIRLAENTYVDLAIDNGTQGYKRNDLIVARYTKNAGTGVEECNLVVIKGTDVKDSPVDPAYTTGDILSDNCTQNDMPLWRVPIDGLTVGTLVPLFSTISAPGALAIDASRLPIVPVSKGGTGASAGHTGLANLFAAGPTILSSYQYGDTLPAPGTPGRIFFKKVT